MSGMTEFLQARLAEDVAYAHALHMRSCMEFVGVPTCSCDYPARVLADVEAKRRIVEAHRTQVEDDDRRAWIVASRVLLRALALPYADHPDFRQEWKP